MEDRVAYDLTTREDGATVLSFRGTLTILEAGALKQILQSALEKSSQLVVDCSDVKKMDFSWLQLLCSAHRSACGAGKSFALIEPLPEAFHVLKLEAGFDRHCSCPMSDSPHNCIWVGSDHD